MARLPSGVIVAALTPFEEDSSVAVDALATHVDWLLDHGADGVLLFGTVGEGWSLSVDERLEGLDAVVDAGIPADRLLVGTGASALPDAAQLTKDATTRGIGGVLVPPPFHFRGIGAEGVFKFFDQLIQRVGDDALRLYLYHFSELTGVPIAFSTVNRLRNRYPDQIAGIKDSDGEWDHTEALCRDFADLQVFPGTSRLLLPTLRAGGAGCITATGNVTVSLAARVRRAWTSDENADDLQDEIDRLRTAFASLPTIAALKHILGNRYGGSEWERVRAPLVELSEEEKQQVNDIETELQSVVDLPAPPK